jgi:serralysin
MTLKRTVLALSALLTVALSALSSRADFHFWFIKEIYTNQAGTVQFIELFTSSSGQQFLDDHSINSNSATFPFLVNSPTPTNGHHLLLATPGFATIPGGATPNYTIPSNFFSTTNDTINFGPGASIRTFASIPTDGVMSLNYTAGGVLSIMANSPRNFANQGTSVNLPPPTGDYNGDSIVDAADYVVWRKTLNDGVLFGTGADGDADGTIDEGDYNYWRARFGHTVPGAGGGAEATGVPEPATLASLFVGVILVAALTTTRKPSSGRCD